MGKSLKILVSAGCVVSLAGLGVTAGALASGGNLWSLSSLWRNRSQDQDSLSGTGRSGDGAQSFADVRKIDLEVGEGYVIVQPDASLEHEVEITVPEPEKVRCAISQEDGELELEFTREKLFGVFGTKDPDWDGQLAVIRIPDNYQFDEVNVEVGMGAAELYGLRAEQMNLSVDMGAIKAEDAGAARLSLDAGLGGLEYGGTVSASVEAGCDLGQITMSLSGKWDDFNYKLDSKGGNFVLGEREYAGLSMKDSIENQAAKWMELECDMGSIEIDFTQ